MRVFVDSTEPGAMLQQLGVLGLQAGIPVQRTLLHKRPGSGVALRERHPFYGVGSDYLCADGAGSVCAAIERKTLEDLARSVTMREPGEGEPKIFRQLRDIAVQPNPVLLIEGFPSQLYRRAEPAILGLQFWCVRQGIGVVYASSPQASARAVMQIARKLAVELDPGQNEAPPDA